METLLGIVLVGLLVGLLVFGLIGYRRGKSLRSCCDLPTDSRAGRETG